MPKSTSLTYGPVRNAREMAALMEVLGPTFNMNAELRTLYAKIARRESFRAIREGTGTAAPYLGGCAMLQFGQFFGGKSVPMIGVSVVGTSPEHRGRHVATTLMQCTLREMHHTGWPLAALYPATVPVYRSAGYELAGTRHEVRVAAKQLILRHRADELQVRRITPKDDNALREVYRAKAAHIPGHVDRSDFIWQRVKEPRGQAAESFAFVNPKSKAIEGYVYYVRREMPEMKFSIHLTDFAAITPAAARQLWSFLADHRSIIEEISFEGSPNDAVLSMLPERNYTSRLLFHWMLRIVDVPLALNSRGYPAGLSGEVHLDVEDDLVTANNGRFVLNINHGKPSVQSGGRGDLKIDIRGLAPLYSGHQSPHQLLITGQLQPQGKVQHIDHSIEAASAAFGGISPWMPDMF